MTTDRQQADLDLWHQWNKSKDPKDMRKLMDRLTPLVQREVSKWGGVVPLPALEAKAKVLTVKALKSYNPNRGAAIGTHVTGQIRKLSRSVYPYQNVARLPENKQLFYNTFQVAQNKLLDETGREPTVDEMADELGWPQKRVADFQRNFARRELVESEGAYLEGEGEDTGLVDFYYHGLAPTDKKFFEDVTGYGGMSPMNNSKLMKKYKLTQGQLSYKKQKFVSNLTDIQKGKI